MESKFIWFCWCFGRGYFALYVRFFFSKRKKILQNLLLWWWGFDHELVARVFSSVGEVCETLKVPVQWH